MKPIKWGFKFWYCCASTTGFLYQLDLYLGKKEIIEYNLGESVVLTMSKALEQTYCTMYFDNFFNSTTLIKTLFDIGIYGIGTVRSNRKGMLPDRSMEQGDVEFQFSTKVGCCKWFFCYSAILKGWIPSLMYNAARKGQLPSYK